MNTPILAVFTSTAVVLAAVAGFLAGGHEIFDDESSEGGSAVASSPRLDRLDAQLSRLTDRLDHVLRSQRTDGDREAITELSRRVDKLAEQVVALRRQDDNQNQSTTPARERSPREYFQRIRERAEERQQHIDDTFANQTRDEIWASSMTVEIEEAFQEPELSAGRLASTDCRATMCRVEVLHDTQDSMELFEFQNHLLINLAEEFPTAHTRQVEGPDGLRTVVHFVRKGEQLPQLDNSAVGVGPSQ